MAAERQVAQSLGGTVVRCVGRSVSASVPRIDLTDDRQDLREGPGRQLRGVDPLDLVDPLSVYGGRLVEQSTVQHHVHGGLPPQTPVDVPDRVHRLPDDTPATQFLGDLATESFLERFARVSATAGKRPERRPIGVSFPDEEDPVRARDQRLDAASHLEGPGRVSGYPGGRYQFGDGVRSVGHGR